jgi:hypothetical protein
MYSRNETARPRSQISTFMYLVSDLTIPTISHRCMNLGIVNKAEQFNFWEYRKTPKFGNGP